MRVLPTDEYARITADLELVSLDVGTVLHRSGHHAGCVHFWTTAALSPLATMETGALEEIATIGNDDIVGIALFRGGAKRSTDATVQIAGFAYRITAEVLRRERGGGELHHVLLRYAQALFTQMAQTAACNRHHSLEKQSGRSLLLRLHLLPSHEVTAPHDAIASLLGVRRAGVSEAARHLRTARPTSYTRRVLDRKKLEECACECSVVRTEVNRLLPSSPPSCGGTAR